MKSSIARHTVRALALVAAFGAGAAFASDEAAAPPATAEPERQGAPATEAQQTRQAPQARQAPADTAMADATYGMGSREATRETPAWLDNEAPVNGIFSQE